MLGRNYRFQALNGAGSSVDVTVKARRWKFASDGSRTDDTEATPMSAQTVGAGAYGNSSGIDNSSDKWLGADLVVTFAPSASITGTVTLYLQHSTDGGSTWPSDGLGLQLGSHTFNASASSVTKNMAFD